MSASTNVVMNYTETEAKVREATNDDAWGPTGGMMQELAQATFTYEQFPEVMSMLWKRMLQENKRNWRRTYKSLLLLNYLVRNGSERVVTSSREHIYDLRSLENYTCTDEYGKDQGINIRHKVRELIDFIQDDDKLREERKKAKKNKDKYVGLSSEAMGLRFAGADKWSNNPNWNKPITETRDDWANDNRRRGYDDGANSDDGEREDSENDTEFNPKIDSQEYRDTMDAADLAQKVPQKSASLSSKSPTRTTRSVKKVDLGAAANYGKEPFNNSAISQPNVKLPSSISQQNTQNDIYNVIFDSENDNNSKKTNDCDDFNPRANTETFVQLQNANADFGEFTSGFSDTGVMAKESCDFADFSSAFNHEDTAYAATGESQITHQIPVMGKAGTSINNFMIDNLNSSKFNYAKTVTNLPGSRKLAPTDTDPLSGLNNFNALCIGSINNQTKDFENCNKSVAVSTASTTASPGFNTVSCQEETISSADVASECAAAHLLETLYSMDNDNQKSLEILEKCMLNYIQFLPGPITPQKYTNLHSNIKINYSLHGKIIKGIIDKLGDNWPSYASHMDTLVKSIVIINEASVEILFETLITLTDLLKQCNSKQQIFFILYILEEFMKSDILSSAIINACKYKSNQTIEVTEFEHVWKRTVQLLVSLPNYVANKLNFKTPDVFLPTNYSKIIIYHIARSVSFISQGFYKCNIYPNLKIISIFLNKSHILFNSESWACLTDLFSLWCLEDKFNERRIIHDMLKLLHVVSIEHISILILKRCDPKFGVNHFFGELIMEANWMHVLVKRIPFMSYYNEDCVIVNLISYMLYILNHNRLLPELLIKLLEIWSNQSALNRTSLEQHTYITKLIIFSSSVLKNLLKPTEQDKCQKLLLSGINIHLESTSIELKVIGMITGELIISFFNKEMNAPRLKFDFPVMEEDLTLLIKSFRKLQEQACNLKIEKYIFNYENNDLVIKKIKFSTFSDKKIHELGIECNIQCDFMNKQIEQCITVISNESTDTLKIVKHENLVNKTGKSEKTDDDDFDIDSDDDLKSYNMSNDVALSESFQPIYLREVRDKLINADFKEKENLDMVLQSLMVAEKLILEQLPSDDDLLAIELLEIFINLREIPNTDNFNIMVLDASVAAVTVYPKQCAVYLCKEFYSDVGNYSVSQRLLILDILSNTAIKLSNIQNDLNKVNSKENNTTINKLSVSKIIPYLVDIENTKRYKIIHSNDNYDLEKDETSTINWQEIVNQRIALNTKRFVGNTKLASAKRNKFGDVASSFLYPLLYGFSNHGKYFCAELKQFNDQKHIILLRFLKTLTVLMISSQNCLIASKVGKEILDLVWILRHHNEAEIRLAVIENIAAVIISVPNYILLNELVDYVMDIKLWLIGMIQNVISGECDTRCRNLGTKLILLINSIFK
ncbi:telomere length regulation protein TEL2 homolog isoform X2 [Prorops nasuta]|uniref:telomere length regulation protein TEL2 homolog isoform X2 n=1 Tax=Prorops nasuta TaxID=863751 RepID=UPI0034CFBC9A